MAKKKKKTTSRRRVSGINPANIMQDVAGVLIGAAGAALLTSKVMKKSTPMVKGAVAIGAGVAVKTFMKSSMGNAVGNGMIAVGGLQVLKKVAPGIISGVGEADTISVPVAINGPDDLAVIAGDFDDSMAGSDDLSVLAGDYAMAGDDDGMAGDYAMAGDGDDVYHI